MLSSMSLHGHGDMPEHQIVVVRRTPSPGDVLPDHPASRPAVQLRAATLLFGRERGSACRILQTLPCRLRTHVRRAVQHGPSRRSNNTPLALLRTSSKAYCTYNFLSLALDVRAEIAALHPALRHRQGPVSFMCAVNHVAGAVHQPLPDPCPQCRSTKLPPMLSGKQPGM